MMVAELRFDASEIANLSRAIAALPDKIKTQAMQRAMRRMRDMAKTRVIAESVKRTKAPPRIVQRSTKSYFDAGNNSIDMKMKMGWIGLIQLNARQTRTGVTTRARGSYKSAFIATMGSGHRGVMMRGGKERLPIHELFGPNPAHDITKNPDQFVKVLADLIGTQLAPRVLHEIDFLLPR